MVSIRRNPEPTASAVVKNLVNFAALPIKFWSFRGILSAQLVVRESTRGLFLEGVLHSPDRESPNTVAHYCLVHTVGIVLPSITYSLSVID